MQLKITLLSIRNSYLHLFIYSDNLRGISRNYRHGIAHIQNKKAVILLFYKQDGGPTI